MRAKYLARSRVFVSGRRNPASSASSINNNNFSRRNFRRWVCRNNCTRMWTAGVSTCRAFAFIRVALSARCGQAASKWHLQTSWSSLRPLRNNWEHTPCHHHRLSHHQENCWKRSQLLYERGVEPRQFLQISPFLLRLRRVSLGSPCRTRQIPQGLEQFYQALKKTLIMILMIRSLRKGPAKLLQEKISV